MQSLMNRLMYLLSANQDTEELIVKGNIENQITRDMAKDFKTNEMESVLPDEESVVETWIMLLEHRLEKERDYSEEINQRFERFFVAFDDGSKMRSHALEAKSKYIVRELKDNINSFDDFYHKTLQINEIINKAPQEDNKFTKFIQNKKESTMKRLSESLDTQSNDDATSIGSNVTVLLTIRKMIKRAGSTTPSSLKTKKTNRFGPMKSPLGGRLEISSIT